MCSIDVLPLFGHSDCLSGTRSINLSRTRRGRDQQPRYTPSVDLAISYSPLFIRSEKPVLRPIGYVALLGATGGSGTEATRSLVAPRLPTNRRGRRHRHPNLQHNAGGMNRGSAPGKSA